MARGYLGKISAVVAVNTDDARAKLSASAKDFTRYARSVQSTIGSATSSAGRSFDAIFTPLQRLQRALAATQNGSLGRALNLGIDQAQVTRIQQFASASELLQKPLAAGVTEFVKLSRTIQGEFQPALVRAQTQVEAVREEIARFGQVSEADFAAVEARVNRTTQAIERLTEASRLVQNASVPNSIRVTNPQQFDALTRAGNLQQRSAALSAQTASSFGLNAQQSQIEETSKRLARQLALRERLKLQGEDTSGTDQAIAATTQKLTQQLGVQENLVDAAERYTKSLTQAASTSGPQQGPPLPPGFGGDSRFADFGLDLDDPRRQLEVLKGSVVSLKGQLDTLPAGIRAQFIPAIQQAEANLRALAASPAATADQLENARNELDRLNRSYRQISQVQAIPNFAEAFEGSALRGAIGNLQAFQQIIARVGAEAGSEAAVQFDRMRAAVLRAANDGTLGTRAFAQELQRLTNEAAEAASATGRISQNAALREIRRGGDIARGGFDNLSLAVQQAAFAIDDFFSSTGDFTQRIRAVQNNITQLAFILGGTTGLFIGLGVAITAQAAVALYNWVNGGRTAEDQTKALNDALARQKSLVEELAQAFESLGDSIARRAFSDSAQEARAFRKELDDIAKKQRELNEARVADLDVNVQRERANQNRIRGELESSRDPARRALLQAELESSRVRERQATENAVGRGAPDFASLRDLVLRSVETEAAVRTLGRPDARQVARDQQAALDNLGDGTDLLRTRQGLQDRLTGLRNSPVAGDRAVTAAALELEQAIAAIDLQLDSAVGDLARNIIESSLGAALSIEQAQDDVADAIRRGVAGAADFQAGLDNTARQLDEAQKQLAAAAEIQGDPERRAREIERAQGQIDDIRRRQDAINEGAREVRLTTGRGGERTTAALSALQGNERFANEYGRLTARLRDAVDAEFAARNALAQATVQGDEAAKARARADLDAANAASDLAASVAEAALAMEEALSRIRKIGDDAISASTSIADEAQRRFTQDPTEANRRDRDAAERQLIQDRERVARANNALDRARSEAESSDPRIRAINDEIRAIQDERTRIGDLSAQDRTPEDARRAEELANREAQLQAERAQRLNELTQAERAQQDAIAQEIDSRRRLIEQIERERAFDEQVARRRDPEGDAVRGLDLFDTPAQRAAREAEQGILDIAAAFDEQIRGLLDANGGLPNADILAQSDELRRQRDQAAAQFAEQQQRAAAPAIFNLADSVENAILQGPSRAALNVSDISTQEGARELNRLLRGEDSARDQNLVELQKQSQELQLVNQRLTEVARQVGVAL
jgi:hypothetical protein